MLFVSYAQNFEDVILWRALGHVENGFYIDIGAQDPKIDSVSLAFYERGWRGVSVEPVPAYADRLRQARPGEFVEQVAIGLESAPSTLHIFPDTGLSTADAEVASRHTQSGFKAIESTVQFMTLDALLSKYGGREIHWLKVDVEGLEFSVLKSWEKSPIRPWVLLVESTAPSTQHPTHEAWEHLLIEKGYQFSHFDGLNRFYVHTTHRDLIAKLSPHPNIFDNFTLSGTSSNSFSHLLKEEISLKAKEIKDLQHKNEKLRIKISSPPKEYGLIRKELIEIRHGIHVTSQELVALRQERDSIHQKLDRTQRLFDNASQELDCAQRMLDILSQERNALHNSLSWRVTAPMRWLFSPDRFLRQSINFSIRHAIQLGQRPLSWLIRLVLRHPRLSERIHWWLLKKFPALHGQLRAVAGRHDSSSQHTTQNAHDDTLAGLTPRARQIHASLISAIPRNKR
ncbi:FkbM family methyltransferase [Vandammella animalimorsus]|uniref:FkbM family methyltransferase n=1 Tax=Vandammella animalimorsus TaxID=2029117 RepID=UPI00325AB061